MAPLFRRKNLVCFYCNKKSNIKYDGHITRWDCTVCESTNFLDENGDITDPPVATENAAPQILKYASTTEELPSSQGQDIDLFCATCQKNQHLYTASLAQYHVETDPSHPRYRELEREYFAYRKGLERRYPQVCEDCEPKVLERMRQAGRTAKADHLRRLMDKSRARNSVKVSSFSFSWAFEWIGKLLWYVGVLGQLSWSIMALLLATTGLSPSWMPKSINSEEFHASSENMYAVALASLVFSIASIWWNPMFHQMNTGFMNHITGFRNWYKLQLLSVIVRGLLFQTMGTGVLSDPHSPVVIGAHMVTFAFILLVSVISHRSLKIDLSPLWASTPKKLANVGPKSTSPTSGLSSLADALDSIIDTPSKLSAKTSVGSRAPLEFDLNISDRAPVSRALAPYRPLTPAISPVMERTGPSLLDMSESESLQYMTTGQVPVRLQQQDNQDLEEMEWTPTASQSQHRAFNPPRSSQRISESFNQAPTADQASPFWFKVPPAPVTPAQRLRNPPNQPTLRISSQEAKENFFNKVTRRVPSADQDSQQTPSRRDTSRREIAFAQQKFFPPPLPNEAGNTLADLLTGFSLGNTENESPQKIVESQPRRRHASQCLILVLGLLLWAYIRHDKMQYSRQVMITVMTACIAISIRGVLDHTIFIKGPKQPLRQVIGIFLGAAEVAGAIYGLVEVAAGRGAEANCTSAGNILIGGMFVHELCLIMFGG